jgi:hypothetical protein
MTSLKRTTNTPDGFKQEPQGRDTTFDQVYIGFVRDSTDAQKMGRLRVWIPELGGDGSRDSEQHWHTMTYCSPFAGATPIDAVVTGSTNMHETQQSYGFWFVPPDYDNEVICMFINGDPQRGIWIGCLYQQLMNHMVPGIPPNQSFEPGCGDNDPPVCEYNKKIQSAGTSPAGNITQPFTDAVNRGGQIASGALTQASNTINSTVGGLTGGLGGNTGRGQAAQESEPKRPVFQPLHQGLYQQGLYGDTIRGAGNAGARRESPSEVFGIKTPIGQHLVMDDHADNEYIRFRTKGGAQIMINETNGFIYMITRGGNSWMELHDSGIDIYSTGNINMRTHKDFNLHVDGNYNVHVNGDHTTFVGGSLFSSVKENIHILTGSSYFHDIAENYNLTVIGNKMTITQGNEHKKVEGTLAVKSAGEMGITSDSDIKLKGSNVKLNSGNGPQPRTPEPAQGKKPQEKTDREMAACEYPETKSKTVVARLVTHEPFDRSKAVAEENQPPEYENMAGQTPEEQAETAPEQPMEDANNTDTAGTTGGASNPVNLNTVSPLQPGQVGPNASKEEIQRLIIEDARRYGIDPSVALAIAEQESSFRPGLRAGSSSATGVYQFIDSTWLTMVANHGDAIGRPDLQSQIRMVGGKPRVDDPAVRQQILNLRTDPSANVRMGMIFQSENIRSLQRSGVSNVGLTETYAAHFLGTGGASQLLRARQNNPSQSAASLMPAAARSNPTIFYHNGDRTRPRSNEEVYGWLNNKMAERNNSAQRILARQP